MNTPGLRDSVVMRVLSDFYWTAATGAGLFTSNSATQCSASCWTLRAGGMCTLLRTSFVDVNTDRQSIKSGKYPWCNDLSLCGKNMHSTKARFVLLICKLLPGVVTLQHFLSKLSGMDPMGFTHIGDWVGRGLPDDLREEFRRGDAELPLVTKTVLCAKIFS